MSGRRIDLSATQVIASMLAAMTGAVGASYLGVAGTVIGAAVMSVASTAVAAIYKHYLASSRERLRAAAEAARMAPLAGGHIRSRHHAADDGQAVTRDDLSQAATRDDLSGAATRQELSRAASRQARAAGPDDETQILPAVAFRPHRWDDTDRANGLSGPAAEGAGEVGGATQIIRRPDLQPPAGSPSEGATEFVRRPDLGDAGAGDTRADGRADGPGSPGEPAGDDARDGSDAGGPGDGAPDSARWRRPRPLALAGIALGIFLLAMAGITAFEALAGKPLNTLVGGGHGSGTTIGSIVGGSGHQAVPAHTGPARPSPSPSPTPHASTSPAPTPTPSQTPTPTPTPTPSPAPSTSGGQSPAASPGVPASTARAPATPASSTGP
jgi:hypothetical protein